MIYLTLELVITDEIYGAMYWTVGGIDLNICAYIIHLQSKKRHGEDGNHHVESEHGKHGKAQVVESSVATTQMTQGSTESLPSELALLAPITPSVTRETGLWTEKVDAQPPSQEVLVDCLSQSQEGLVVPTTPTAEDTKLIPHAKDALSSSQRPGSIENPILNPLFNPNLPDVEDF